MTGMTGITGLWTEHTVPASSDGDGDGAVRLAVGRTGRGPLPLIALHGITSHHHAFNAVARHLAYSDGLLGVDLRGRGDSDKPDTGSYGMAAHARDVVRVLDAYSIERGVLVGHSMGGFVALHTALLYPGRVQAVALLDSGWPRVEAARQDDKAIQAGLARAFSRLTMTFATPEDYLTFWFPGQALTFDDLPPDLADNYRYDLRRVADGWQPKCLLAAAVEDARWLSTQGATAEQLAGVTCPVALVRAAEGFFTGTPPLIGDEAHAAIAGALDVRVDVDLPGSNHYTMMYDAHAERIARAIDEFVA